MVDTVREAVKARVSSEYVVGKDVSAPMTGIEIWRKDRIAVKALISTDLGGVAISRDMWSSERLRVMVGAGVVHPVGVPLDRDWKPVVSIGMRW